MHRIATTFLFTGFLCFVSLAQPANENFQEKHALVKLQISSVDEIAELHQSGLDIDHYKRSGSGSIEFALPYYQLDILKEMGRDFQVIEHDLQKYYTERLARELSTGVRSSGCDLINYELGSKGGYHTYAEVVASLDNMKKLYPGIISDKINIGTSYEGRTIWAVKISDKPSVDESGTEPAVYFDALTHAREPMGMETLVYYMWWLLENYEKDPQATYLVNNRQIYFVPVVNPDGYVHNDYGGMWRKNRNAEQKCVGVDLNRNYDPGWAGPGNNSGDPCSGVYYGKSAFSESETRAVRDFTGKIQPVIAFSNHTYSDVFIHQSSIDGLFPKYAEFASEFIPDHFEGYGTGVDVIGYLSSGSTRGHLESLGALAWTPEIGESFWPEMSQICPTVQKFVNPLRFITWTAGAFACYHDFSVKGDPVPGQEFDLDIRLKNRGLTKTAGNVEVTVNSLNPDIIPLNSLITYGDINKRSFASNTGDPFRFQVSANASLFEPAKVEVIVRQEGFVSYRDTITLLTGKRNVLFEDNAEAGIDNWMFRGNGTQWDTSSIDHTTGSHSFCDSKTGNYTAGSENSFEIREYTDLTGAKNPYLEFDAKWSFDLYDHCILEVRVANQWGWTPIKEFKGSMHWQQIRIDLDKYKNKAIRFRFHMVTDASLQSDGFYFDNFSIADYNCSVPLISVQREGTFSNNCSDCDLQARVSVGGNNNSTAYNYNWNVSGIGNTSFATGLCSGTYTVSVSDDAGCANTASFKIDHSPVADFGYQIEGAVSVSFENASLNGNTYLWDFGDGYLSKIASPTYSYSEPGVYEVTLITSNDCGADTISKWVQILSTSLSETGITGVKVYPNPNKGIFTIDIGNLPVDDRNSIQILNAGGQLVYSGKPVQGEKQLIDLSGIAPGIYFVNVVTRKQSFYTKMIVH